MRSCGLDIASCTGLALVGEGEDRGKTIQIPNQKGFQKLQLIATEVGRVVSVWKPDLVVIERYAFCRNVDSLIRLVEIGTLIRSMLYEQKVPWVEVPPTVLKKETTGRGNADKTAMSEAVLARWGFKSSSHDIVDAYALAQMGQKGLENLLKIKGVFAGNLC